MIIVGGGQGATGQLGGQPAAGQLGPSARPQGPLLGNLYGLRAMHGFRTLVCSFLRIGAP